MRIRDIQLEWFRGAADRVSLDTKGKSTLVYGANGSGKSSFVDAIEYVLNDGKIGHLSHEYSGKRLEKAIPNTHKPHDRRVEVIIKFKDESELKIDFKSDGSSNCSGAEHIAMNAWEYQRTVLRQDEVSAFIHQTKLGKYSALLPLLGLHSMEVAAENLRQLAKSIEDQAELSATRAKLKEVKIKRQSVFGADDNEQILHN